MSDETDVSPERASARLTERLREGLGDRRDAATVGDVALILSTIIPMIEATRQTVDLINSSGIVEKFSPEINKLYQTIWSASTGSTETLERLLKRLVEEDNG